MRGYRPGVVAYKNIETIKLNSEPKKKMGAGLLTPKSVMKNKSENKVLQPVERSANYVMAIREQREAYKNGA
tara:strand:- start:497 stop:712 length:216 start_codon:yes stop_codon:yes gene_type:complete